MALSPVPVTLLSWDIVMGDQAMQGYLYAQNPRFHRIIPCCSDCCIQWIWVSLCQLVESKVGLAFLACLFAISLLPLCPSVVSRGPLSNCHGYSPSFSRCKDISIWQMPLALGLVCKSLCRDSLIRTIIGIHLFVNAPLHLILFARHNFK